MHSFEFKSEMIKVPSSRPRLNESSTLSAATFYVTTLIYVDVMEGGGAGKRGWGVYTRSSVLPGESIKTMVFK